MASAAHRGHSESRPIRLRGWLVVVGGAATAAVILAAWLPFGALLAQRDALRAASGRLTQLSAEGRALTSEAVRLRTPELQDQLARELYQLVLPGQRLIQVLPPTFRPTARSLDGPFPGDPGYAPIVDPSDPSPSPTVAPSAPASSARPSTTSRSTGPGFLSRVLGTLEFWR